MEEEYKMLRAEIDGNIQRMHSYINVTSSALVALLAYMTKDSSESYFFLFIFVALAAFSNRVRSLLQTNMNISTYMEIILEPMMDGRNWESLSHWVLSGNAENTTTNEDRTINKHKYNIIYSPQPNVYVIMGILSYFFYSIKIINELKHFNINYIDSSIAINVIVFLFNTLILINLLEFSKFDANNKSREAFKEKWRNILRDWINSSPSTSNDSSVSEENNNSEDTNLDNITE